MMPSLNPIRQPRAARWMVVLLVLAIVALAAPWLAPFDPARQLDLRHLTNAPPSLAHPLGTDAFSRDLLSRALYGARTTLVVAGVATLLAMLVGTAWGTLAWLLPHRWSALLVGLADTLRALPRKLVLLALLMLTVQPSPLRLAVLLGVTSWMGLSQLLYVELRRAGAESYVDAARALGMSSWRLARHHVWPAVTDTLAASGALLLADLIALEAALSFLGLGVRLPIASWGNMLQEAVPTLMSAWWIALVPATLIVITVGAVSSLATAVTAVPAYADTAPASLRQRGGADSPGAR